MTGPDHDEEHEHGDYAEGQEKVGGDHEDGHTGSFAEGQAEEHPHGGAHGGDFAQGQESSDEHDHHEGDFAEGQEDASGHEH